MREGEKSICEVEKLVRREAENSTNRYIRMGNIFRIFGFSLYSKLTSIIP